MIIDILFLLLLALAVFKGFSRGLIIAVFSFLAVIAGLAAATKLSVLVANYIGENSFISKQWLPFLSFTLVMVLVFFIVKWIAYLLRSSAKMLLMGWVDKLGGVVFYAIIYIAIFSVLLFYAAQMNILKPTTIAASKTYLYIEPFGPKMINALGYIIPFFKNIFEQLQDFFSTVALN
ncbi:MAG: CvpA family protein [Bacteroidota bacterium]